MQIKKFYVIPDQVVSKPITFNEELCTGCNRCVEVCQVDVFIPNPEKGKPPIQAYSQECWYCGTCVDECDIPDAIQLHHLLRNKVRWIEKGR